MQASVTEPGPCSRDAGRRIVWSTQPLPARAEATGCGRKADVILLNCGDQPLNPQPGWRQRSAATRAATIRRSSPLGEGIADLEKRMRAGRAVSGRCRSALERRLLAGLETTSVYDFCRELGIGIDSVVGAGSSQPLDTEGVWREVSAGGVSADRTVGIDQQGFGEDIRWWFFGVEPR